ncbi:MAG: hypothetical protein ACRD3H_01795 [Terriglobales bacterium]
MLHKCANPDCVNAFRSLSDGKLFLLETENGARLLPYAAVMTGRERPARRVERYWLCDDCCSQLTLTFQPGRGMVTVPLGVRNTHLPVAHLTQLQSSKVFRAERSGKDFL